MARRWAEQILYYSLWKWLVLTYFVPLQTYAVMESSALHSKWWALDGQQNSIQGHHNNGDPVARRPHIWHNFTSYCVLKCPLLLTFSAIFNWLAEIWEGEFSTPTPSLVVMWDVESGMGPARVSLLAPQWQAWCISYRLQLFIQLQKHFQNPNPDMMTITAVEATASSSGKNFLNGKCTKYVSMRNVTVVE